MKRLSKKDLVVTGAVKCGKTYYVTCTYIKYQIKNALGFRYYFLSKKTVNILVQLILDDLDCFR